MSNVHVLSVDGSHWVREEDYRKVELELAEARAALREVEDNMPYTSTSWWMVGFRERHAAALKAAREAPAK
jgi:hypothetical protein